MILKVGIAITQIDGQGKSQSAFQWVIHVRSVDQIGYVERSTSEFESRSKRKKLSIPFVGTFMKVSSPY